MQQTKEHFEIVLVTTRSVLLDEELRERVYWRRDGVPLAGGYYLVSWPEEIGKRLFNEDASFRGPFKTRDAAYAAMRNLAARPVLRSSAIATPKATAALIARRKESVPGVGAKH